MIKTTDELTTQELLTILQARTAVFVVEQKCPYQEVDEADRKAVHICIEENGELQAYANYRGRENHSFWSCLSSKKISSSATRKENRCEDFTGN